MNDEVIYLLKILEVALIASIKFVIAPFEAERYGFDFKEAFAITTTGGIIGIIIFSFVGEVIAYSWRKVSNYFRKLEGIEKPRKKITWIKKFAVRIKIKFGLLGLVIATPAIVSIPIGSFVIHRFYKQKIKSVFFLFISLICWSLILNGLAQYLKLSQYLPK